MLKRTYYLLIAFALVACSGGGGDGSSSTGTGNGGMVWDQGNFDEKNWQ